MLFLEMGLAHDVLKENTAPPRQPRLWTAPQVLVFSFYIVTVKHLYSKHTFNKFAHVVKCFKLILKLLDILNYIYKQSKSVIHGTLL